MHQLILMQILHTTKFVGWFNVLKIKLFLLIEPLHKWRLNLNNNTWYILSLTLMSQDKGIFT